MDDLQKILPVTKVKRDLLDILKAMEVEDFTVTLTRNGLAVGIIMTPGRYEALIETIEILANNEILKDLESSAKDFTSNIRFFCLSFHHGKDSMPTPRMNR